MLKETIVDEEFIKSMSSYRDKPVGKTLLEACSDNVVLFSEYMLGIKLYSWQINFLSSINKSVNGDYHTREFLALTSRQIGKSLSVSVLALWACTFNKVKGGIGDNTMVGIFSASDIQAKKLLYEIKRLINRGDKFLSETYGDSFGKKFFSNLLDDDEPNNTTTITFKSHSPSKHGEYVLKGSKSGSTIKSYPPTSSVLGETFTILVEDEAGKAERFSDAAHNDYISPTGDAYDAIRIYTSTPWVLSGFFYRLADPEDLNPEHLYDRFMFSCDAIAIENPKQYEVIQKKVKTYVANGDKDTADRAYYCKFVKGESSYFDPFKVRDLFSDDYEQLTEYAGKCDMGVDFGGQTTSRTVITISALDEQGVIRRLYHRAYGVQQDNTLLEDIKDLLTRFNVQRIIPDECPQGDYFIRDMKDLGWDIQPMNFRSDKIKKYGAFRAAVNRGDVRSYRDDELKIEMNAMEFGQGSRQSILRHAPGYSDDLIDSFVMSAYFFVQEEHDFKYYDMDDFDEEGESWYGEKKRRSGNNSFPW